jgi:DNA-binding transcriptional ArsR family regulator
MLSRKTSSIEWLLARVTDQAMLVEPHRVVTPRHFDYDRTMEVPPSFVSLAALLGDPARANMLSALKDGRALTALELACCARVTPQTANSHLAKLCEGGLISVEKSGRYRYFRLASPALADMLEELSMMAPLRPLPERRRSEALMRLRDARMCYDHVAGWLGVGLTECLVRQGCLEPFAQDYRLTAAGTSFVRRLDVDLDHLTRQRRAFARGCLDWSERRCHLGGALGAAMAAVYLKRGWLARVPGDRRVELTPAGRTALPELFPSIVLDRPAVRPPHDGA